jgi:hypothetical protein
LTKITRLVAAKQCEDGIARGSIRKFLESGRNRVNAFILKALFLLQFCHQSLTFVAQYMMSNAAKESSSANDLLKNSSLYREFQAEREEILRHKWIESEKAGCDIGFEHALTDWIIKHRAAWRKTRQAAGNN